MLRVLLSIFLCFCMVPYAQASVSAEEARVLRVDPVVRDGKLYIDADIELPVGSELRNAAEKGVPIYFTADVEVVTKRWWWLDKVVITKQQTWRIVYNALTRQWRVGTGELSLPEPSLNDALSLVRNIRGWDVADVAQLEHDENYEGRIRLRLNTSLLARPFQIDAFNSSAWSLVTPWKNFNFSILLGESPH